jgi:NADPH2:quinone reductase
MHSGSVLRPKDLSYKSAIANDLKKNIIPIIESGKLLPVIFKTFKLEDAYLAHELMKSGKHFGKIVLV